MASKLSTLASILVTPSLEKFCKISKYFVVKDMSIVTRKLVYFYDYTDSWSKLEENSLPSKEDFYSTLYETAIDDDEYIFIMDVWSHFDCCTLGEYSDLYLKIDVLLLTDVFEVFRNVCMKAYAIDPASYYTAPGMSFDCMLQKTGKHLELLADYEMLFMFEFLETFIF